MAAILFLIIVCCLYCHLKGNKRKIDAAADDSPAQAAPAQELNQNDDDESGSMSDASRQNNSQTLVRSSVNSLAGMHNSPVKSSMIFSGKDPKELMKEQTKRKDTYTTKGVLIQDRKKGTAKRQKISATGQQTPTPKRNPQDDPKKKSEVIDFED